MMMASPRRPYLRSERGISQYGQGYGSPRPRGHGSPARSAALDGATSAAIAMLGANGGAKAVDVSRHDMALASRTPSPGRWGAGSPARYGSASPARYGSTGASPARDGSTGSASPAGPPAARLTSPGRRRAASPSRTHAFFDLSRPPEGALQLPVRVVVDGRFAGAAAAAASERSSPTPPTSAVFQLKLMNAGKRTERSATDDALVSHSVLDSVFREQLQQAGGTPLAGTGVEVCPRCKSETSRLYAGRVCPRCSAVDVGSAEVSRMIADRSARGAVAASNLRQPASLPPPDHDAGRIYSASSRESELHLVAKEAEAAQAEKRLVDVLRRAPPERAFSPSRNMFRFDRRAGPVDTESLRIWFDSRESPRLSQLLQDFPARQAGNVLHTAPARPTQGSWS